MSELKSCPFCGGEAELIEPDGSWACYHVHCNNECCIGWKTIDSSFLIAEKAIKAWNNRAERTCENITEKKKANQFECSKCHCIMEDAENYYVNVYERGKFFNGNTYDWN